MLSEQTFSSRLEDETVQLTARQSSDTVTGLTAISDIFGVSNEENISTK